MNRFEAAAVAIRAELVLALREARADFEALPGPTTGPRPISGMSLDLHIEHGYAAVSLRTDDEKWEDTHIGDGSMRNSFLRCMTLLIQPYPAWLRS